MGNIQRILDRGRIILDGERKILDEVCRIIEYEMGKGRLGGVCRILDGVRQAGRQAGRVQSSNSVVQLQAHGKHRNTGARANIQGHIRLDVPSLMILSL